MTGMARGKEREPVAALPVHGRVHRGLAVAAGAATVVAVALGTEVLGGSRGRGRLPSPMAGCAELTCRARSRVVLCGARRGPDWPCVDVRVRSSIAVLVLSFVVSFL